MKKLSIKEVDYIMEKILCFDIVLDDLEEDEIKEYYEKAVSVIIGNSCILSFFREYTLEEIGDFKIDCIYELKDYLEKLNSLK